MSSFDFRYLSPKNNLFATQTVTVANGAVFTALSMPEKEKRKSTNVLYMHVQRESRKCYVGITIMSAADRWDAGIAYRNNRRFGNAISKYGWDSFDSYILAFGENRDCLNKAEVEAIAAAGGHKSKFTYNLSPGGDLVAENDKPIVGVYLPTLETRSFKSGSDAARQLGMKNTDMPMGVARGDRSSVADWWFRFADDLDSKPPEAWGDGLRVAQVRRVQAKSVIALNLITKEERQFPSTGEAGRVLGIEQSQVVQILKGDGYSAKDWWFRYEGDDRSAPEIYGVAAIRAARDKKIFAVHLKTGERREFRNCTVADNELNIYKGAAAMVASGERTSAADWWFTYDPKQEPPTVFKGALVAIARSKAVIATDIATGHKCFFQNAKAASEKLGISRSMISMVIKGKRTSAKGYVFRFA